MSVSKNPNWTLSKMPHSCTHCQRILIRPPRQPGPHGFRCRLPHTTSEVLQAAKDDCPVFKMLLKGYLFATNPRELRQLIRGVQGEPDIRLPRAGVYGNQERIVYLAESLSKRPFSIRFDEKGQALFACMAWGSYWLHVNASPSDPTASVFPTRPINRDIACAESFQLARTWLNECVRRSGEDHKLCPNVEDVRFAPTRLVEFIVEEGECRVRLRETLSKEVLRYVCLSYCWGGDQPVKTTQATLAELKVRIDFESLPKTLQDAMIVTHELQCSLLWVDCLCIVQDNRADLARELPKMPEIYKNAWVTISASSASSCFEGFLQQRHPPAEVQCEDIRLRYECPDGKVGNVHMFQDGGRTALDPIDTRAWTLQERRISPRVLDFRSDQLRWRCKSRAYYDGGYASEKVDEAGPRYKDERSKRCPAVDHGGIVDQELVERTIFQTWPDIVDDYTQRSLSFPGDKLVALAAIAHEVGSPLNMTYLAGLWKEHLPAQLLWRLWNVPAQRPQQYRAPSWSWASIDGWVMMEHETHADRIALEVLECMTELANVNFTHGPVNSGLLTVKGRLLPAFWFINQEGGLAIEGIGDDDSGSSFEATSDEDMTDASDISDDDAASWSTTSDTIDASFLSGVDLSADAVENGWDTKDRYFAVEVRCLQVMAQSATDGAAGLMLILADSSANTTYQRVGHFYFEQRKNDVFADADEQVITIA